MSFLDRIIDTALSTLSPEDLGKSLFLFPSKRAILFFTRSLKENEKRPDPLLMPELMTLSDWIIRCGGYQPASREALLLQLYRCYRESAGATPLSFEQFYPHAQAILVDIVEIDRALLSDERIRQMATMAQSSDNQSSAFYTLLELLPALHASFCRSLLESGQVHDALALRSLLNRPETLLEQLRPYPAVFACGFYPINQAEIELFRRMHRLPQVRFIWDTDRYFIDMPDQEAGLFFTGAGDLIDPGSITENDLLERERRITLIETQGDIDQAKATAAVLSELAAENTLQADETALILPDESLLLPLLSAIPADYNKINITMGYPLSQTHLVSLLHRMQELHRHLEESDGSVPFKPLYDLLVHPEWSPFLSHQAREQLQTLLRQQSRSIRPEEAADLLGPMNHILVLPVFPDDLFGMILTVLEELKRRTDIGTHGDRAVPKLELLYQIRRQVLAVGRFAASPDIDLSIGTAWQLLWEFIDQGSIPFSGEPLEGLQIMGMLETRCLDFNNLIILSFNEGTYPRKRIDFSLIPPEIRKLFGLTGQREQDARAAYHFYRLLKRCRHSWLIYNGSGRIEKSNEASRFVKQIEHELVIHNPLSRLQIQPLVHMPPKIYRSEPSIPNHSELRKIWSNMHFSASAVNCFLKCPMMFFYRYGLRLEEKSRAEEEMDSRGIGLIAHACLETLFRPYIGRTVNRTVTTSMQEKLDDVLSEIIRKEYPGLNTDHGRPYLERRIMSTLLEQLLKAQAEEPPFRLEGVEKHFSGQFVLPDGTSFQIQGHIDRIDRLDNGWRIVDYKSGSMLSSDLSIRNMPEEFREDDPFNRKNILWQLLFYHHLFCLDETVSPGEVRCGRISLRNPSEGFMEFKESPSELYRRFRKLLEGFFMRLTDPATVFCQTPDENTCRYCPYADICQR